MMPAGASASAATQSLSVKITSGPEGTVSTSSVSFSFLAEGTEQPGTTFACAVDAPAKLTACTSPDAVGPLAPGPHTFYVIASNHAADAYSGLTSRTFTVAAPAGTGTGTGGGNTGGGLGGINPGGPRIPAARAPSVASLTQSASRWREGSALARISSAMPRGTTFSFTLNEAAVAHLTFTQALSGRSVAGRCVAQTRHNRTKRSCRRTKSAGTLALSAPAGADHVRFEGRLSSSRKLKPGRYTVALSASAAGLTSVPRSLSFTIVS